MNSLISQSVNVVRTQSACVWLEARPSGMEWHARVYIRGIQGLWYLACTYHGERPTSEALYFNTYQRGLFSARPFRPGNRCDASTDLDVLALVCDFCREHGVDAAELIQRAGPSRPLYSRADFVEAKRQADWEGTLFPVRWEADLTSALCLTLADPSWGDLARLITKMKT
jgi:hypothetical protein